MSLIMKVSQKCDLAIVVEDSKGNPAAVDGIPNWSVSNPTLLTVEPSVPDGMSAVPRAVDPVGTSQVSVQVDADLGEGVKPITGLLEVQLLAGDAVTVDIETGTPAEDVPEQERVGAGVR